MSYVDQWMNKYGGETKGELDSLSLVDQWLIDDELKKKKEEEEKLRLEEENKRLEAERQQAEREFEVEMEDGEARKLQRALDNIAIERAAEIERFTEKRDLYKEGTQAWVDADNQLLAFKQQSANQEKKINKDIQKSKMDAVTGTLSALASIAGENSKFGKGIAVAQAIMDTYKGANAALGSAPPPYNFIMMAAVIAAGLVNVKNILSTKPPPAPSFAKGQQPVQAYVVSNDVTTAQSLERNIVDGASI